MKKPKYIICPGKVMSKNDQQIHYINSDSLVHLYNVNKEDCIIANEYNYHFLKEKYKNAILLFPKYSGNYKINEQ